MESNDFSDELSDVASTIDGGSEVSGGEEEAPPPYEHCRTEPINVKTDFISPWQNTEIKGKIKALSTTKESTEKVKPKTLSKTLAANLEIEIRAKERKEKLLKLRREAEERAKRKLAEQDEIEK